MIEQTPKATPADLPEPGLEQGLEQGSEPAAAPVAAAALIRDGEAAGRRLKSLFPALFAGAPKPLKLRIQADIEARAPGQFSKAALTAFLRRHTGSTAYLSALQRATQRFDLDGQPAGELSEDHRAAAKAALAQRRERVQAREAEMEAARRWRADLLRDWERSSFSRANFCALKGVADAALDALLEQARTEAAAAPQRADRPPRRDERTPGRRDERAQPRRDERQRREAAPRAPRKPQS